MNRILVSACLIGHPVRYNGVSVECHHPILQKWLAEGRVVPVCPEVAGGMPNARLPAEIAGGHGGVAVWQDNARVIDSSKKDITAEFVAGARLAAKLAIENGIRVAILKEGSPSCGVNYTYDGTFSHRRISAAGVTAEYLRRSGIQIFSETQIDEANLVLDRLDGESSGESSK